MKLSGGIFDTGQTDSIGNHRHGKTGIPHLGFQRSDAGKIRAFLRILTADVAVEQCQPLLRRKRVAGTVQLASDIGPESLADDRCFIHIKTSLS